MLEEKSPQRTPLSELGEFGLIKHITSDIPLYNDTVEGVGDDCAVIDARDEQTLVSTDMLVEGVHFDLSYVPLTHLGYKAAVVNFSDIYAMNGQATQLVVSLAVSSRFPVEAIEELYRGLRHACERFHVDLVGGDTTSSTSGLILSLTVIGKAKKEKIVKRSGAKPSDLIVVSGDLGGAYMGLQILEREKSVFIDNPDVQPDLQGNEYILERQLKPEARQDVVKILEELDVVPTSMIDISDGLSSEILHICEASKRGCRIFEEKIPIDPTVYTACEEFNLNTTTVALNGGEDYELLFTIALEDFDKIKGNPNLTVIGHITEDENRYLVTRDNNAIELTAQGWNPIKGEE
ncbi:thiamine-phosphate kinase [Phaeocystidibacter marisrubri]|uniref:Thiamine-monophosphate kinase n=1 Tax=Phaeocystidibacter marisrubri TaxID=1577780 RepID=A0A6L3ZF55_9FLAO|nr:thiamine-phosphate kinase [Phaeocystidibacter marisrubri]KAB2816340.1 thiamine-phosphate kinase [Phaeocystidibacter marisrubri]GGH68536.1 thiamine-monophosphate kinase [Phaeocystidibacter marisrubri]